MKITASMLVHNELDRYLRPCIEHLQSFCDDIAVLDDHSTDGTSEWLEEQDRVEVLDSLVPRFFEHEGNARNALLQWTLSADEVGYVLAIDADEFVADGQKLRNPPHSRHGVYFLTMTEIWKADADSLWVRVDNQWRPRPVPCFYFVNRGIGRIPDRALACGREPEGVRRAARKGVPSGTDILHFGWTNEAARAARYERYAVHDGGKFHANAHLESIMWPDSQVGLQQRDWPEGLADVKDAILEAVNT